MKMRQGNLLVRKREGNGARDVEIVFLDHGLYERLSEDTQFNFASLWRAIILQDKVNVKKYSQALGTDLYKLFSCTGSEA
jgi:predicted unusual protein kinase regulating ubiquinone biosynthesis (AarF/ABC1/UbiB family)